MQGEYRMLRPNRLNFAIAACAAAMISASPSGAQNLTPHPVNSGNPTCIHPDVLAACNNLPLWHELEITDVTTSSGTKCNVDSSSDGCNRTDFDSELGTDFEVHWVINSDANGSVDVTDHTTEDPGARNLVKLAALIAEGKKQSNVYCPGAPDADGITFVSGVVAPVKRGRTVSNETPTKLTFCWAPSDLRPCLLTPSEVVDACEQYPPVDPNAPSVTCGGQNQPDCRVKNYLQAHRVAPNQRINVCGCPPEEAVFCGPEGCPNPQPGDGSVSLATQGVATIGTQTCQRVVIGGRAFFIGDTCE